MISFIFSNPKHHLEMMAPVVRELALRGQRTQLVSLAELRGLRTPTGAELDQLKLDAPVVQAMPALRSSPSVGAAGPASEGTSTKRRLMQGLIWNGGLRLRMRQLLHGSQVLVLPNDAVFPYQDIIAQAKRHAVPWIVLQEGIRFPFPNGYRGSKYGSSGAARLCVWGQGSAEHFLHQGVAPVALAVTGNPRFDQFSVEDWRTRGAALQATLGLASQPLALLTNPIELQGFCDLQRKYALVEEFLAAAAPLCAARDIPIVIKNHLQEDTVHYQVLIARIRAAHPSAVITLVTDAALFAVVAMARAAVVMASTAGLEALLLGVPLGVLELPPHGFAFEYVAHGAAIGLRSSSENRTRDIDALLAAAAMPPPAAATAFVERHLAGVLRTSAASKVADVAMAVRTEVSQSTTSTRSFSTAPGAQES